MSALTNRQRELLRLIVRRQQAGTTPSTRELARELKCCQNNVLQVIASLERQGFISRPQGVRRVIRVLRDPDGDIVIEPGRKMLLPIHGYVPAGLPSAFSGEPEGSVCVDASHFRITNPGRAFALKVRGDSMEGAHIVEGDIVIMDARLPQGGDVVAALIDGETTLKRLVEQGRAKFLRAENPRYTDLIPLEDLQVQGVMVGLVRGGRGGD